MPERTEPEIRRTHEGVRGAIGVRADEAAAETPEGTPSESAYQQADPDGSMNDGGAPEPQDDSMEVDFVGETEPVSFIGSLEPSFDDEVSSILLSEMGSSGKSYRRDQARNMKRLVSEIYSPPRATEMLRKLKDKHLMPGFALDITVNDPFDNRP